MLSVKICGLRRREDILAANLLLPEYVGFVFAESKRRVTPEQAAGLRRELDARVGAVGVFVNAPAASVAGAARQCALCAVQLHGGEDGAYIRALRPLLPQGCEIWRAVRVSGSGDIAGLSPEGADRLLLDAYSPAAAGGTGKAFDWGLLAAVPPGIPFLLAGGIAPENAARAARAVTAAALRGAAPLPRCGIDVSSGVETGGFKDAAKMERLLRAVRAEGENRPEGGGRHQFLPHGILPELS